MTPEEALALVSSLSPRGWRLGLDRMQAFVERAGLEKMNPRFIHIAGTNGKGSVTAFTQSILHASGWKTGAYFSPYVIDPMERWQLGNKPIGPDLFAKLVEALWPVSESFTGTDFGGITEFEFKTALGFELWRQSGTAWVAIETGLGGRLDATNVIDPAASVIVSIGLDHINILGDTLEEIATEKGGIIKPQRPVILGEMPPVASNRLKQIASEKESTVWEFGHEIVLEDGFRVCTPARTHEDLTPGLLGSMQPHNMALAVAAIDASGAFVNGASVRKGCLDAYAPGRFERRTIANREWILDGAHNGEAAEVLAETLRNLKKGPFVVITGMVEGHDPARFYRPLLDYIDDALVVPIDSPRTFKQGVLAETLAQLGKSAATCDSVQEAIFTAKGRDLPVLVTGSFYLIGEVVKHLS